MSFLQSFFYFLYNLYIKKLSFLALAPKAAQDPPLAKAFKPPRPAALRARADLASIALPINLAKKINIGIGFSVSSLTISN